jgi:hypothetical protein
MSDAHFSFSTGEVTVFLLIVLACLLAAIMLPASAAHIFFHVRWLHAIPGSIAFWLVVYFAVYLYVRS